MTTSWSATSPPSTAVFCPLIVQESPDCVADVEISVSDQRESASVNAKASSSSPLATPGRTACFCSGVPAAATSAPPSTTVATNGSSTSALPKDSMTTYSSSTPMPAPPYCSSKVSPSNPSSAYCFHIARDQPSSSCSSSCSRVFAS